MRRCSIQEALLPRLLILCCVSDAQSLRLIPAGGAAAFWTPQPWSPLTRIISEPRMYRHGQQSSDVRWRLRDKLKDDHDLDTSQPYVGDEIAKDDEQSTSTSLGEILILVFPLLLIYISNQWSRYSISYLVDFSSPTDATTSAVWRSRSPYCDTIIRGGSLETG